MLALSLLVIALPIVAAGASLGLAVYRPGRGLGWAILALGGSAMMLALPVAVLGLMENRNALSDPTFYLLVIVSLAGMALFFQSVLRKLRASMAPPPGRCPGCGYDRAGLNRGLPCPECGGSGIIA